MKAFRPYVDRLEGMATNASGQNGDWTRRVAMMLNGEPGRELAAVISLRTRRRMGAFFTGETLAQKTIPHLERAHRHAVFFDPACGVGDLLLAAARLLPVCKTLHATLLSWGERLAGCDTNPEFVRATKSRLVLLARQRGVQAGGSESIELQSLFPLIYVRDALNVAGQFTAATWIVLNPPYGYVNAPAGCRWASGKLTAAAVFFEACIRHSLDGTRITAILPDVLRSGSRYEKWRQMVATHTDLNRVEPHGLFDRHADVDVFVLDVTKRLDPKQPHPPQWLGKPTCSQTTVSDFFHVHVGPVVPHRHRQVGTSVAYIHARSIPAWEKVLRIKTRRRFNGTLFQPPFVVIRRTSRPGDKHRATGTLVLGSRPVAVENHLVICQPHDGRQRTCEQLLAELKMEKANQFLNFQIRCRHLTVDAVKRIPLNTFKPCR